MLCVLFGSFRFGSLELEPASMAELLESSVFSRLETLIWAAKLVFVFVGFISTVFLFKVAVIPYTFTLPTLWISLQSWLSPLFLYIIVNFIIFVIVISSVSPNQSKPKPSDEKMAISGETTALEYKQPDPNLSGNLKMVKKEDNKEEEKQMVWNFSAVSKETVAEPQTEGQPKEYFFPDFGEIEGGVEEEVAADDDSLEATWQSIMEAKGNDGRHLKKSETFGTPLRNLGRANGYGGYGGGDEDPVAWAKRELRKSDTFNDRVSYKREKSMSQEELKRRSEEFIDKINSDMRLQRLESAKRFLLRHR